MKALLALALLAAPIYAEQNLLCHAPRHRGIVCHAVNNPVTRTAQRGVTAVARAFWWIVY